MAEGHLLIEDRPGVGKTTMAKALATSIDTTFGRIQFTPDLLPSDVVGVTVFDCGSSEFLFRPRPVFANIVLADEINRASPKTQSALLEAMAEGQVTIDGRTHTLNRPFVVIATQNRSSTRAPIRCPTASSTASSCASRWATRPARTRSPSSIAHGETDGLEKLAAVVSTGRVSDGGRAGVHVAPAIKEYLVDVADATRRHPYVWVGMSPAPPSPSSALPGLGRPPPAAPT